MSWIAVGCGLLLFFGGWLATKILDNYLWPRIKKTPATTSNIGIKLLDTLVRRIESSLEPDEDVFYKDPTLFVFSRINEVLSSLWRCILAALATVVYCFAKNHIDPEGFTDFVLFMLMVYACADAALHFYYILKRFDFLHGFISSRYDVKRKEERKKKEDDEERSHIDEKKVQNIVDRENRL